MVSYYPLWLLIISSNLSYFLPVSAVLVSSCLPDIYFCIINLKSPCSQNLCSFTPQHVNPFFLFATYGANPPFIVLTRLLILWMPVLYSTLYAVDSVRDRYETLCKQVEKHGATCVKTLCMDAFQLEAKQCPGVEYILVDPTCSGSGKL